MTRVFVAAVIIESPDPAALAKFYREALRLPFEPSDHSGRERIHYDAQLGDVHLAIYPVSEGEADSNQRQRVHFALAYQSLDEVVEHCRSCSLSPLAEPEDHGYARKTQVTDPDGNHIELVELSPRFARSLRDMPAEERDITLMARLD